MLQDQNFSVINVPIEVMRDHPRMSQSREPRGPDFRRTVSSTPTGASSSKAKPTRLAEKTQPQDSTRTVTRAQSKADKQSGSTTRSRVGEMLPLMQLILISRRTLLGRAASREEIIRKSRAERDLEADQ